MPEPQRLAYRALVDDKRLRHALEGKQADVSLSFIFLLEKVLGDIGKLQKLCNHPALVKGGYWGQKCSCGEVGFKCMGFENEQNQM